MNHETFELNNELVAWIKSQGLTMAKFASDIGVSRATMTHISNHRNKVSDNLLQRAQKAYPNFPIEPSQKALDVPEVAKLKPSPKKATPPAAIKDEPPIQPIAHPKPYEATSFMAPEQLIMVEGGYFDIKLRRDLKGK